MALIGEVLAAEKRRFFARRRCVHAADKQEEAIRLPESQDQQVVVQCQMQSRQSQLSLKCVEEISHNNSLTRRETSKMMKKEAKDPTLPPGIEEGDMEGKPIQRKHQGRTSTPK